MRFRSSLVLGIAATVVALAPATAAGLPDVPDAAGEGGAAMSSRGAAVRQAADHPTCTSADAAEFPLVTRIHPGPGAYEAGGEPQDWTLDISNSTDGTCGDIHPVLVLVDQERTLKPRQVRLEFADGARWREVRFQRTGQGENVGVFDDGFPGFTVGPGRTVTVEVRLSFTPDAEPDHVVASAALVQRRDDDGDWVGASNDYPFDIVPEGTAVPAESGSPSAARLQELAETGTGTTLGIGIASGAVLLGVGALTVGARRLRAGKR
ncbi:hypothetical protein DEJ48_24875 [Streptomyces venezuelae]|uniref:Gram-positive cocci surface proteins LPxTG domain-containing protein n=1 Tax=Streptomyces venezuelae TaxID=54571 RepID=A0A5P2C0B1_STRVZ|nr:hypothetical protein [Streptomyces venezuelae]QES36206.1 hypothetical protein DEJ48_24875 [Streptomyces venezuelae]